MIPNPLTDSRLLIALDDSINPKTGRKIFGCAHIFDLEHSLFVPTLKNILAIQTPGDDMINRTGDIESSVSRHATMTATRQINASPKFKRQLNY
jgi:predicted MPP superfamily phosphohydrolase